MAAVVAPVGVQDAQLGLAGVAAFFLKKDNRTDSRETYEERAGSDETY